MAEIEPTTDPAANVRPRRVFGTFAAFILAFACGVVADRQLGIAAGGRIIAPGSAAAIVAGAERPPGWIADFAGAFCKGDAAYVVANIGGELAAMPEEQIAAALARPKWTCARIRYLGHATNPQAENFVFVTTMDGGEEMWWVFAVVDQKVVAIQ
jgi:hypothetical protein